jgi:hypothetical protein
LYHFAQNISHILSTALTPALVDSVADQVSRFGIEEGFGRNPALENFE